MNMMKKASSDSAVSLLLILFLSVLFNIVSAADPDPFQDVCVADLTSGIKVNGYPCKMGLEVNASDFYSSELGQAGTPNNIYGIAVTLGDVNAIPGLNTQGISVQRADLAPGGMAPPHSHPRATEVIYVLDGTLDAAFITTANQLVSKSLKKGDVYTIPRGLIHFVINTGPTLASVFVSFNSQNPGIQTIPVSLFAAKPTVPDVILVKSFLMTLEEVRRIKGNFSRP